MRRSRTGWRRSLPRKERGALVQQNERVFLRAPTASDRQEFVSLMRASRSFHKPWATAPTDEASLTESKMGTHVVPAPVVFQTPPAGSPM